MLISLYGLTLALSAFLMFWVQPLVGKMILPSLGGASAVWMACMLFFQGVLLAGYCYAHLFQRLLRLKYQIILHCSLLAIACFTLPFNLSTELWFTQISNPALNILQALTTEVGFAIILLSASTPLLQHWFFHSHHTRANDPYFLYSASNIGSLAALLAFPTLLEPFIGSTSQSFWWTGLYVGLFMLVLGCSFVIPKKRVVPMPTKPSCTASFKNRFYWLLLSFAPSSLLLAVTNYVTMDIAAVPLLWVIPLAIYLLTFIIAFAARQIINPQTIHGMQEYGVLPLAVLFVFPGLNFGGWMTLIVVYFCFFICVQACHFELARRRPHGEHLTEYYLWLAFGGFLGGVFNALLAPLIFNQLYELPITLVLCTLLRPYYFSVKTKTFNLQQDCIMPLVLGITLVIFCSQSVKIFPQHYYLANQLVIVAAFAFFAFSVKRPIRMGLILVVIFLVKSWFFSFDVVSKLHTQRTFYGIHTVFGAANTHMLVSGKTLHGAQVMDDKSHSEALVYYKTADYIIKSIKAQPRRIAAIGLGTGTVACFLGPQDTLRFYELDQSIVDIATNPAYFTYLQDCPVGEEIVVGDGRLQIQKAAAASFDLIILDAFSSDAIPIHLLTRQAFEIYFKKLKPNGLLAVHVSNKYLDIGKVVKSVASSLGLNYASLNALPEAKTLIKVASQWVVVGRDIEDLTPLLRYGNWQLNQKIVAPVVWTDDYSNILRILK